MLSGYYVEGGSEGVGKATMRTVVLTCLAVVVMDFVLASVLFVREKMGTGAGIGKTTIHRMKTADVQATVLSLSTPVFAR